jgi:hypothetical protein
LWGAVSGVSGYRNLNYVGDRVHILIGGVDGFLTPDGSGCWLLPAGYPPLPLLVNTIVGVWGSQSTLSATDQTKRLGCSSRN